MLNNTALVKKKNLVGVHQADKAMRDDDCGMRTYPLIKRVSDVLFGASVYCRGGVIEYKDRRIGQCAASDRYSLFLAA